VGTGPDSFFMALTLQMSRQGKLPPKLLDVEHEAAAAVQAKGQGGGGGATSASQATEIGMFGSNVRGTTWSRKMKDAAAAAAARELRLLLLRHMAQQHVYYMQVTGLDAAGMLHPKEKVQIIKKLHLLTPTSYTRTCVTLSPKP
jgi:hypothetical protein